MSLIHILVFAAVSMSLSMLSSGRWRTTLLSVVSILALYSLQPSLGLRSFDFWLPTMAIMLTAWIWIAIQGQEKAFSREDRNSFLILLGLMISVGLSGFLPKSLRYFVSLPTDLIDLFLAIALFLGISWGIWSIRFRRGTWLDVFLALVILGIFIGLKAPELTLALAQTARAAVGQSPDLASALDLNWLGFSYIAFRLLHTLRDHRSGRLPPLGLKAFLLFVFFFPALSAGPIDRIQRFINDLASDRAVAHWAQWQRGGARIARGLFKKFILADTLALIALDASNAGLVSSRPWLWLLLYLYSFRIYFDFSGYTDIAIGIGVLSGIDLPENFNQPYRQTDIGAFWNRWHITLAQWFRAYVFNPLTRYLRQSPIVQMPWLIILIGQTVTMVLIGLWHGITWNFFIWGLWHAGGLFIHNRWLAVQRLTNIANMRTGGAMRVRSLAGWLLTFNFVSLGWVWFLNPDIHKAWSTFLMLLGGPVG